MNKPDSTEDVFRKQLNESIDTLDNKTLEKLKSARVKALAAQQQAAPQEHGSIGKIVSLNAFRKLPKPALSLAASLLLAAPLLYFNTTEIDQQNPIASIDALNSTFETEKTQSNTIDLISSFAELNDDELDMVDELDFALWLVEQENANSDVRG